MTYGLLLTRAAVFSAGNDDMREHDEKLLSVLRRATAAELPSDTTLDADTASLREGWLALGQLLESQTAAALVPGLDGADARCVVERAALRRRRVLVRRWSVSAAVAAAVVLAVFGVVRLGGWAGPPANGARQQSVVVIPKQSPRVTPRVTPLVGDGQPRAHVAWDDAIDAEIVSTAEQLAQMQQSWRPPAGHSDVLGRRLNELEQELRYGPL
jgi:hypothetical protein